MQKCERNPKEQEILDERSEKPGNKTYRCFLIKTLTEAEKKIVAKSVLAEQVKIVEQVRALWKARLSRIDHIEVALLYEQSEVPGLCRGAVRPPSVDDPPPQEIIDFVCNQGCVEWRKIGRGLGYDDSKLTDIVSGDPTCVDSEKLHRVLANWKKKHGSDATLRWLVEVCQSDNVAIYGAVDIEIRRLYGTSIIL